MSEGMTNIINPYEVAENAICAIPINENGTASVKASAGAEAYLAKGEVSGGFTIFGIQVDLGIEGGIGVLFILLGIIFFFVGKVVWKRCGRTEGKSIFSVIGIVFVPIGVVMLVISLVLLVIGI